VKLYKFDEIFYTPINSLKATQTTLSQQMNVMKI